MSELTKQDIIVLDKLVKEVDGRLTWIAWKSGEKVLLASKLKQAIKCKDVEHAVVLARQYERERCLKEIEIVTKPYEAFLKYPPLNFKGEIDRKAAEKEKEICFAKLNTLGEIKKRLCREVVK